MEIGLLRIYRDGGRVARDIYRDTGRVAKDI